MNIKVEKAKREDGFTLIELLVVVIIIGILAAIAIPVFLNQRERAWVRTAESDARNAAIEVETFFNDNFAYPVDAGDFTFDTDGKVVDPAFGIAAGTIDEGAVVLSPNIGMRVFVNDEAQFCIDTAHDLTNDNFDAAYNSATGGIVTNHDVGTGCVAEAEFDGADEIT